MKIAIAQTDCEPGNVEVNTRHIIESVGQAANEHCDLIVFPEMCDVGYDLGEAVAAATTWRDGTLQALSAAAQQHNIHVVAGLAERSADVVYNTVAVINRAGELAARYRKIHLITADPICEQNFIEAGNELCRFDVDGTQCGLMTCYDIRFPEMARALASHAEILLIPAAFPLSRIDHWIKLSECRAIENQVFVVACNRTGEDAGVRFGGNSRIVSPTGDVMASLDDEEQGLAFCTVDPEQVADVRARLQVWSDRRPDLYQEWMP